MDNSQNRTIIPILIVAVIIILVAGFYAIRSDMDTSQTNLQKEAGASP